jgi:dihydrofolate reductase/thymidylate synthase
MERQAYQLAKFDIIVAVDDNNGIAKNGNIPWLNTAAGKRDLKFFRDTTIGGTVIMGRKTYLSIGKPLAKRTNIVVSSSMEPTKDVSIVRTFEDALKVAGALGWPVYVIGGAQLYATALVHPNLERIIVSSIGGDFKCDQFFPQTPRYCFSPYSANEDGLVLDSDGFYKMWNPSETRYLALLGRLLNAPLRQNRTGIPTRGLFAEQLRFNLMAGSTPVLPLLTTKRVPLRLVLVELIWFLRGSATTEYLQEQKCKIWDDNTTREFLDGRGLTDYQVGETGPIYGYQWRKWNEKYRGCKDGLGSQVDGLGSQGIDQLQRVIETLKTNPFDRRMIVSAWNPEQIDQMVLPPCHWSFQFYVTDDRRLCCLMNMRSADVALGVPFNIASYGVLTHVVAGIVGLTPGELVISMADCHIYENHIDGIKLQLGRIPRLFPEILVPKFNNIDEFVSPSQIKISEYYPHDSIAFKMAV